MKTKVNIYTYASAGNIAIGFIEVLKKLVRLQQSHLTIGALLKVVGSHTLQTLRDLAYTEILL